MKIIPEMEITATTEDGGFEAKCFVNVVNSYVDVQTLSVKNTDAMTIKVGDSVNAIVTVSPSNAPKTKTPACYRIKCCSPKFKMHG